MKDGNICKVSYHLNPEKILLSSGKETTTAKWSDVSNLWIEANLTVLFFEEGTTMIPTKQIPLEAVDHLFTQVSAEGDVVLNMLGSIEEDVTKPDFFTTSGRT